MISKNEAKNLFDLHSIFVVSEQVMPYEVAAELTSAEAVEHAARINNGKHRNGYGIGDYTMMYLDKQGFYYAVTYHNVESYRNNLSEVQEV